jgi:hypothetical protein
MAKHTTKAQDAEFMRIANENATRAWKEGDECMSFAKGAKEFTNVVSVVGDNITLADGSTGHRTRMVGRNMSEWMMKVWERKG